MIPASVILQLGAGARASIPGLVAQASPFSKAVLLLLVVMSVYAWAVIWNRSRLYKRVASADAAFLEAFRRMPASASCASLASRHKDSVLATAATAGERSFEQHPVEAVGPAARFELAQRAMDRAANDEVARLEKHIGFLATTGTVAPFIGLMGTVWGVMVSFVNIGAQGSASLVVVAPGIAEALIATIAGLAAAIPAVIGYNHCLGKLREIGNVAGSFTSEFLDREIGAER